MDCEESQKASIPLPLTGNHANNEAAHSGASQAAFADGAHVARDAESQSELQASLSAGDSLTFISNPSLTDPDGTIAFVPGSTPEDFGHSADYPKQPDEKRMSKTIEVFSTASLRQSLHRGESKHEPVLRQFGNYELLREIARGGMGVVYKARQLGLNRIVAIKMILSGQLASQRDVSRFFAEAEAAANLRHPNIVSVHDVGVVDEQPYFSMDFIDGRSLSQIVANNSLPNQRAAQYTLAVAEAIEYAHQNGILHRDLKPSNVLLDETDQPRVTDFGLAKRIESDTELTASGAILGTPGYMPPEQAGARNNEVGPASDVYSIGAMLYELLTGRPPFKGPTPLDTILLVLDHEPVSLRTLNRGVDRDLETICLKCLQKIPARRYGSARHLADDLSRYLKGEPILARPIGRVEKAWRWARRNPYIAGLCTTITILLAAITVVSIVNAREERRLREDADQAKTEARHHAEESKDRLVRQYIANGSRLIDERDLLGSLPWFVEALRLDRDSPQHEALHRQRIAAVLEQCPKPLHVWFHDGPARRASFNQQGTHIVSCGDDGTVRIYDVATGKTLPGEIRHKQPVTLAVFRDDGERILTASTDGTACLWDAHTGERMAPPMEHSGPVVWAAFDRAGQRVATASHDKTARVWSAVTGESLSPPLVHNAVVNHVVFSPDGQTLATGCGEHSAALLHGGYAALWSLPVGVEQHRFSHKAAVPFVAFDSGGTRLAVASEDHTASIWNVSTGKPATNTLRHADLIGRVLFSRDDRRIVTASDDDSVQIWDARTGTLSTPALKHIGEVRDLSMSPDGRYLATAGYYGAAHVWDILTGDPVIPRMVHAGPVTSVEFSPNGRQIVTASEDGSVRLWDLSAGELVPQLLEHESRVTFATFNPESTQVATTSSDATARLWNTVDGSPAHDEMKHAAGVRWIGFDSVGLRAVTASNDKSAQVWNAKTGKPLSAALVHADIVHCAALSGDGKLVATACQDGTARIWDATTGEPIGNVMQHAGPVVHVAFSSSGTRVVTSSEDGSSGIWDSSTGASICFVRNSGERSDDGAKRAPHNQAAFDSDGSRFVTVSGTSTEAVDCLARVWMTETGQPVTPPLRHQLGVTWAEFSPDGDWVVTSSCDDTVRVWDSKTGLPRSAPMRHLADVKHVCFNRDGSQLVSGGCDNTARVWDAETGEPLSPPLVHPVWSTWVAISNDNRKIATAGRDAFGRIWEVPTEHRGVNELTQFVNVLSGGEFRQTGGFVPFSPAEFREAWQRIPLVSSPSNREQHLAWHRRKLQSCSNTIVQLGGPFWFGAAWHLNVMTELEPTNRQLVVSLGTALAELGQWEAALKQYDRAVELGTSGVRIQIERAHLLLASGNYDGYVAECVRLVGNVTEETDLTTLQSTGMLYGLRSAPADRRLVLITALNAAIDRSPNAHHLLHSLALLKFRSDKLVEAKEHAAKALEHPALHPADALMTYLLMSIIETRMGNRENGRLLFEEVAEWIDRETNEKTRGRDGLRLTWSYRVGLDVMRREAEAAIKQANSQ